MKLRITPAVVDSLHEARRIIDSGMDSYICHAVLESQQTSLTEREDKLGICAFIEHGIRFMIDGEESLGTFESWVENTVPEWFSKKKAFNPIVQNIGMGLVRQCRVAWLDRMLYLVERGATALYHDGQWETTDGMLMNANGTRSIFDDVDE